MYAWGRDLPEARRHLEAFEFLINCELEMQESCAHEPPADLPRARPVAPSVSTTVQSEIAAELAPHRRDLRAVGGHRGPAAGAQPEAVMAAYATDIQRISVARGFKTVDVVSIHPEHPDREAMRRKFLDEHFHKEDEVRFFVAGSGLFTLHVDEQRLRDPVRAGDLIGVPDAPGTGSTWGRRRTSSRSASSPSRTAGSATSPAPTSRRNSRAYEPETSTRCAPILTDIEGTTSSHLVREGRAVPVRAPRPARLRREHGDEPAVRAWLDAVAAEPAACCDDACWSRCCRAGSTKTASIRR
jgi:1,2-dihydroxy-3-keto-5-methylthiopentene dioxygenase